MKGVEDGGRCLAPARGQARQAGRRPSSRRARSPRQGPDADEEESDDDDDDDDDLAYLARADGVSDEKDWRAPPRGLDAPLRPRGLPPRRRAATPSSTRSSTSTPSSPNTTASSRNSAAAVRLRPSHTETRWVDAINAEAFKFADYDGRLSSLGGVRRARARRRGRAEPRPRPMRRARANERRRAAQAALAALERGWLSGGGGGDGRIGAPGVTYVIGPGVGRRFASRSLSSSRGWSRTRRGGPT